MKHCLLLLLGFFVSYLSSAQLSPLPFFVPAFDPTTTLNQPVSKPRTGPLQRPAWISQHAPGIPGVTLLRRTYNPAGLLTRVIVSDSLSGQVQNIYTYTYNAAGKLTRSEQVMLPGGATFWATHSYDAAGNYVGSAYDDGAVHECEYMYDAAGLVIGYLAYQRQLPRQARQPAWRMAFTVRNGQWHSYVQERYNGTWQLANIGHRLQWQNWPLRQLTSNHHTEYKAGTTLDLRDTIIYTRAGADSVVTGISQQFSGGSWSFQFSRRVRYDPQGNQVSVIERSAPTTVGGPVVTIRRDSTQYLYSSSGHLLRRQRYSFDRQLGTRWYAELAYYGPDVVTNAARATAALPLTLSPNPATRQLTLSVPALPDAGPVQADIVNALGQVVERRTLQPRAGALHETWNVQTWPAGLYVLRLRSAAGTATQRFLKQ